VTSKTFAKEIVFLCRKLKVSGVEADLIHQLLRCGTSVGANIHEAQYAQGIKDFVSKLEIALKECNESEYWLELLIESGYLDDQTILMQCTEIKKLLISSINTAKRNSK
jgi:four helix bundle protein